MFGLLSHHCLCKFLGRFTPCNISFSAAENVDVVSMDLCCGVLPVFPAVFADTVDILEVDAKRVGQFGVGHDTSNWLIGDVFDVIGIVDAGQMGLGTAVR